MYVPHPSRELEDAFMRRPWQGVHPMEARYVFIGLDANYTPALEHSDAFASVLDYHRDGVGFWRRHGVHHPFLLPPYRGDGRLYHRNFAKIGFRPDHADLVGFVELLHRPTVGRNRIVPADLDPAHLRSIAEVMTAGQARHVFLSATVERLMRASRIFPFLRPATSSASMLPVLYDDGERTVRKHLHFSCYGKFIPRMREEAAAIAEDLPTIAGPLPSDA